VKINRSQYFPWPVSAVLKNIIKQHSLCNQLSFWHLCIVMHALFAASFQMCSCIASAKLLTWGVAMWLYFVSQAGLEQNKGGSFVCCGNGGWLFVLHSYNHYSHWRILWVLDWMHKRLLWANKWNKLNNYLLNCTNVIGINPTKPSDYFINQEV
jgi:hypothetical protein